jgi:integrase
LYDQLSPDAIAYLFGAVPEETRNAYAREWCHFVAWCAALQRDPLPASEADLVNWVMQRVKDGGGVTAIAQGISAVRWVHKQYGYEEQPPSKKAWIIQRRYRQERIDAGWRPTKSATVTVEEFRRMVATLPDNTPSGIRDRAILAVGLSGFFRRINILRLDVGDAVLTERGDYHLYVTRSKTDQTATGRTRVIPPGSDPLSDPVGLLTAWLDVLEEQDIHSGPLFRAVSKSGRVLDRRLNRDWVRVTVKRSAAKAGLKSLKNRPYRAHSLRSSGVTVARRAGRPWDLIKEQGDWSENSTAVFGYEQPEEQDNAMRGVL